MAWRASWSAVMNTVELTPKGLTKMCNDVTLLHMGFGSHVRELRRAKKAEDKSFSVRRLSARVGIAPNYLSKIELEQCPPPSEDVICKLAEELGQDPDVMLAMAGKVSRRFTDAIVRRPKFFAEVLETVENVPEDAVLRVIREVRDGDW